MMTKLRKSILLARNREFSPGGKTHIADCGAKPVGFMLTLEGDPAASAGTSPLILYDGMGLMPLQDPSFNHFEHS